ncbi:DUF2059 domain-containing protein [Parasulfitobacter algicola]|uniref:DUF2059 domain-containing protein n=1 Tax=Parasulfitobacter algicola TaxID=2614809 RepID=A0ABX2IWI2_9RHOB|nr:DUF2059 domain-containing protein [Sulfitobacter algicola]NSX55267.1 DUF2059 domain-containing protein [Sulfitobacter algicola]
MIRSLTFFLVFLCTPVISFAQNRVDPLIEALRLEEIITVMRQEGLSYGDELADDMFPGRGTGPDWQATVSGIYETERMMTTIATTLEVEMEGVEIEPLVTFFQSDLGKKIIGLELSAREAFLDESVEEAANDRFRMLEQDGDARLDLIKEFSRTNDLIDSNVVGAMNSNYAFFIGLIDAGGFPNQLTEEQILTDVWEQEPEIRENTTEWLYSYQLLAYQPLTDDELQAYVEFSTSEEAQAMNRALFVGFDMMFTNISRALGTSVGIYMGGQEL